MPRGRGEHAVAVGHHNTRATLAVLIAPGFCGTIPVRPALLTNYFGTRYFGTVNGAMIFVQTLGAFFGPWMVGAVVDATGRYTIGWLACGAITALSVPLMLLVRPPRLLMDTYMRESQPRI